MILELERLRRNLKKMQGDLQKTYNEMEAKIAERTAELTRTNEELKVGIAERQRAEEALRIRAHELDERVKELKCLYSICNFFEKE
ncbi:MAG: hypothetical protein ABSG44_20980 [Thermodesulfobacteriota bacterium]